MRPARPTKFGAAAMTTVIAGLSGCSTPNPMQLDSTIRLDGPVTMNMNLNGPSSAYNGTYVTEELFEAIEVNETPVQWAIAAFGEPTRRLPTPTQGEYLVWDYRIEAVQAHPLKLTDLGKDEAKTMTSMTVVLEIVQGVVINKWRG